MRFSSLTLVLLAVIAHASMPGRQEGRLTSLNAQELERPVPLEVDVPEMKVAENPTRAAEYLGRGRKASQPEVEKGPPEDYARPTGQLGRITHECPKELLQLVRTILAQPIFDSYKVLGLPHSATDEEIRAAYFKLSRALAPLIGKVPNVKEAMTRVTLAWNCLGSQPRKSAYDTNWMSTTISQGRITSISLNMPNREKDKPVEGTQSAIDDGDPAEESKLTSKVTQQGPKRGSRTSPNSKTCSRTKRTAKDANRTQARKYQEISPLPVMAIIISSDDSSQPPAPDKRKATSIQLEKRSRSHTDRLNYRQRLGMLDPEYDVHESSCDQAAHYQHIVGKHK